MVRHAFRVLTDDNIKTRLIAFSDDMDGLRKVPDNVPNKEMVAQHLGKPLTRVPDPFGTHDSFAAHNNARLRAFLDQFGFDYEFLSSTACYTSGRFDAALLQSARAVRRSHGDHAAVAARGARADLFAVLADHRQRPASCCKCRSWRTTPRPGPSPTKTRTASASTTLVTGGRCKLQWKPDWAMRWVALGVDYEMAGKDLIELGQAVGRNLPRAWRRAARRVSITSFSRRERPENLEVEGQRADHRRVAALRQPGEPVAVHVSRAEGGQAALLRRHPASRR